MDRIISTRPRRSFAVLALALLLAAWIGSVPAGAQSPSPGPSVPAAASPVPGPSMCQSAADLRLYLGFVRAQTVSEDGLVPILVGVAASIAEADRLLGLVSETYRPLVGELAASLRELGMTTRGIRDEGTIGAGLARLGEAITRVGLAMDALSVALREPCPDAASPVPSVAPASPVG